MGAVAEGLAMRGIATLRYQFPYMEAGSKRPDRPPTAMTCVRAAIAKAVEAYKRDKRVHVRIQPLPQRNPLRLVIRQPAK